MIPPLFFYQLALLGLLWLCVMLHLAWPSRGPLSSRWPVESETPVKSRRQRSHELKPRWMPLPTLLYAQVVKTVRRRRLVRVWRPWTPAMAAGLTDHIWTLREVLLFRVPPWPQTQMV
jgi:hypothetical protein